MHILIFNISFQEKVNKRPMWATVAHLSTMNASKIWHQNGTKNNKASSHVLQDHCYAFGGHIVFWISPKNTNVVEDVENLLSVKFRWIPFSGFIGEVKNVSANQRTGRLSCFSDQPENRKPGRGCWDLASCQVLLNSIQRFQRKSWKCLSKS